MISIIKNLRDPISGLTHLLGAILGMAGLVFLVMQSGQTAAIHRFSMVVFSVSLILLYSSSALYHLLNVSERARKIFRQIDHTMIFVLIAGTYTPFCLIVLKGIWGWSILGTVWGLAIAGIFLSIFWIHAPRWLSTGLYVMMGWIIVIAFYPLAMAISRGGLLWLIAGGLSYTVGAIIYGVKWPNPFPPIFGFHEIWHVLVLGGSLCHFFSVATLLP